MYNVKRSGFLTNKFLQYRVAYEKIGKKWYLSETHVSATSELKKQSPQSTVDFIRTELDSVGAKKISYKDMVQENDNIYLIDKPGKDKKWANTDSLFIKAVSDGKLQTITSAFLDTIQTNNLISNPPNKKIIKPFVNKLSDYLSNDNIRPFYGLGKLPIGVNSQFNDASVTINYALGGGINARLYKNLFLGFQVYTNLRSKKYLQLSSTSFQLLNNFVFNKNARAITLAPYAGFALNNTKYQNTKIRYNAFYGGLRVSYELSHKKSLFLSSGYSSATSSFTLSQFKIKPSHYSIGVGLIFNR